MVSGEAVAVPAGMTIESLHQAQADEATCDTHVYALCKALRAYARAHEGVLPPAASWCDAILPLLPPDAGGREAFKCPSRPGLECAYALNQELGELDIRTLEKHDEQVLILPALTGAWNESRKLPAKMAGACHHPRYSYREPKLEDVVGMLGGSTSTVSEGEDFPQPPVPGAAEQE